MSIKVLLASDGVASRMEYCTGARAGGYAGEIKNENKGNLMELQTRKISTLVTRGIRRGE